MKRADVPVADQREMSFLRLIITCIAARLLVDTGVQMFNPFLPIFAAGLHTDVVSLGRVLGLRSATGLFAPFLGVLADRHGYRLMLRLGLLVSAVGFLVIGLSPGLGLATVGMLLTGVGLAGFVPTLQAYLSARLPYAQRARGMGMVEYSWALTGIIGLFAMGQLIAVAGWRAPFFVLAAGLTAMSFVLGALPSTRTGPAQLDHKAQLASAQPLFARAINFFRLGAGSVSTYALILAGAFNFYAGMQIMITHGAWLQAEYQIGARGLGIVALIFGLFDLTASVSVTLFTDRIGKRRSVLIGMTGALIGYMALPALNTGLVSAVLGIAFARGMFEFAVVSYIPLLSEQVPDQRGKVMNLGAATILVTSTFATTLGPWLYTRAGVPGLSIVSTIFCALALVVVIVFVRERSD
jgi:MFS family permease